jgi:hypothetical protein
MTELEKEIADIRKRISEQIAKESEAGAVSKHQKVESLDEGIIRELVNKIMVYPENVIRIQWNFSKEKY